MLNRKFHKFYRSISTMASPTPMTDSLRGKLHRADNFKITESLKPTHLEIHNDSFLHSKHLAMAGNTSLETHFRVVVVSEAFRSKMQPARHRMVYTLMKDELAQKGGIHALQLKTRTPEEAQAEAEREVSTT